MVQMIKLGLALWLLIGITSCSLVPDSKTGSSQSGGPGDTLLAQANAKAASGETQQAIAVLERAVRLQPRNAHAWMRLSELYLEQGDYHKAEQFAGRVQQFAGDNQELQRRAAEVIKQARAANKQRG